MSENFSRKYPSYYDCLDSEPDTIISAEEIRQYYYCKRIPFLRHLHKNYVPQTYLQKIGTELHEKQSELRKKRIEKKHSKFKMVQNSKNNLSEKDRKSVSFEENEEIAEIEDGLSLIDQLGVINLNDDNSEDWDDDEIWEIWRNKDAKFKRKNDLLTSNSNVPITDEYYDMYLYDERLGLIGIIDYMGYLEDEAWPVEMKTGYEPKNKISNPHKFQLVAQAILIESNFKMAVRKAKIRYLLLKKTKVFEITVQDKINVINAIRKIRKSIKSELIPPPSPFPGMCSYCEYFKLCGGV